MAVADEAGAELERLVGPWRLDPPELKRVPAPFGNEHPRAALLRRKGLTVWRAEPAPRELHDERFVAWCLATWTRMSPVADWMTAHGV